MCSAYSGTIYLIVLILTILRQSQNLDKISFMKVYDINNEMKSYW